MGMLLSACVGRFMGVPDVHTVHRKTQPPSKLGVVVQSTCFELILYGNEKTRGASVWRSKAESCFRQANDSSSLSKHKNPSSMFTNRNTSFTPHSKADMGSELSLGSCKSLTLCAAVRSCRTQPLTFDALSVWFSRKKEIDIPAADQFASISFAPWGHNKALPYYRMGRCVGHERVAVRRGSNA